MQLSTTGQRIGRVVTVAVVFYFVAFTALCWFLDLEFPGKLATQTRVRIFSEAGVVSGAVALICSLVLWHRSRWLAVLGFSACLLWTVWRLLPRP